MTKKCTICKIVKTLDEFHKHPKTLDGRGSQCRKCDSEERRLRHIKQKLKLVKLFGGKCNRCGYDKHHSALDFHHKDPQAKEFDLSKPRQFNRLVKEAKKCELLCSNCHRVLHFFENEKKRQNSD